MRGIRMSLELFINSETLSLPTWNTERMTMPTANIPAAIKPIFTQMLRIASPKKYRDVASRDDTLVGLVSGRATGGRPSEYDGGCPHGERRRQEEDSPGPAELRLE